MDHDRISYEWIETLPQLNKAVRIFEQEKDIGVDLEADSLYHYFEKVCLIQIATPSASYIIDPLAFKDLSSLQPIFSNPSIGKVFHGADYDIRLLNQDIGLEVRNLFDTQLACRFLGVSETGLEAVLRNRFQVELNKKYQRADWSKRPLSREMLEYAALDGRYLIPLALLLKRELEEKNRLTWVQEDCLHLSQVRFSTSSEEPLYLKVKGAAHLNARSLTVLETLLEFREKEAQQSDRPPFKIIGNEALLELARKTPLNQGELERANILSPKQIDRFAGKLVNTILGAMAVPEESLLHYPRRKKIDLGATERLKIKALKQWREQRADELGLEPGILLSTALIHLLALKNPASLSEMEGIPEIKRWQQETFGPEILLVLKGEA
jgi:ribonuclease D